MPTAVVFRHLPHMGLRAYADPLAAAGYEVVHREVPIAGVDAAQATRADLLVVLGGPCSAYDVETYPFLEAETEAVRARLDAGRPVLGVCLGAEIMARALGAKVEPGGRVELGFGPVTLTDAGRAGPLRHLDGVPVMHWHSDTYDLPDGCELLASTPAYAVQAFTRRPAALALQFHAEIDGSDFEWSILGKDSYFAEHGLTVPRLRAQAAAHAAASGRAAAALLGDWLEGFSGT